MAKSNPKQTSASVAKTASKILKDGRYSAASKKRSLEVRSRRLAPARKSKYLYPTEQDCIGVLLFYFFI